MARKPEPESQVPLVFIGADHMPATIFATAHDHFALAAFDANAIDYLLKPFAEERFARSVAKVRHRIRTAPAVNYREQLVALLAKPGSARAYVDCLLVKVDESQQLIKTADIVHIGAERNYVRHSSSVRPCDGHDTNGPQTSADTLRRGSSRCHCSSRCDAHAG
ncbi:MAG: hypothetical protein ABI082_00345 [Dokdonella sp.]